MRPSCELSACIACLRVRMRACVESTHESPSQDFGTRYSTLCLRFPPLKKSCVTNKPTDGQTSIELRLVTKKNKFVNSACKEPGCFFNEGICIEPKNPGC